MIVMQDKRENPRLSIYLSSSVKNENDNKRDFSIIRNISSTGVYLTTKNEYTEGSITDCIVSLDDEQISFKGEIVRSSHDDAYYGYGIEITEINNMDNEKLDRFVDAGFLKKSIYFNSEMAEECKEQTVNYNDSYDFNNSKKDYRQYDIDYIETDGRDSRILQAGFPFQANIEEYDFSYQTSEVKYQMDNILSFEWARDLQNILLFGPSGSGKTHVAIGIGTKAIENGYKVSFVTMDELLAFMRDEVTNPKNRFRLNTIMNSRVIIIDEVGMTPISMHEANMFFQFVSKLYGKASIVMTSDMTFEQWKEALNGSAAVSLILDRLAHNIWLRNILN